MLLDSTSWRKSWSNIKWRDLSTLVGESRFFLLSVKMEENTVGFFELFLIAVGLSMDALAISICKGLSVEKIKKKHMIITGLWFGGSQAVMPVIGYFLGTSFQTFVESIDHWIGFILLTIIGINMIKESREEVEKLDASFAANVMFPLAIADSIDALAAGVTFAFMEIHIVSAVLLIGITTFVLSALGVKIGSKFGERYKSKAEVLGGVILIIMGTSILIQDLGRRCS